ncbi:MAG: cyclodeaminase/cyclohydrolase family protein [Thermorudis peleae]|nr:cyclodeaminase/cyclohydrolase family protein [Thermorudis peleae]
MAEGPPLTAWPIGELSSHIAKRQSALGGGVAAAIAASLAAALVEKVAHVEQRRNQLNAALLEHLASTAASIRVEALRYAEQDAQSLRVLLGVLRKQADHPPAIAQAAHAAVAAPLAVIEASVQILTLGETLRQYSSLFTRSDVIAALALALAAFEAAKAMVEANLALLSDEEAGAIRERLQALDKQRDAITKSSESSASAET